MKNTFLPAVIRCAQALAAFVLPKLILAETLVFCRPNNMVSAHAYVAEEQGYFAAQGLSIQFETTTNAKLCMDALISGRADAYLGAEGPLVYLSVRNPKIAIIAATQKNPETAILARRDRRIHSASDLRGKRIGYLPGTISFFYLASLLEKAGVPWDQVKLLPLQPPSMPAALAGSVVDALCIWEPWVHHAQRQLKKPALLIRDTSSYVYEGLFGVTENLRDKNPKAVQKLLAALIKADQYLKKEPQKSISMLSRRTSLDQEILSSLWGQYEFAIQSPYNLLPLLERDFELLKKYDARFQAYPLVNFRSFLDSRFFEEANG